jgi:hypothetical protein
VKVKHIYLYILYTLKSPNIIIIMDKTCKNKWVFEMLWGTQKLLTSVDGIAISQPAEAGMYCSYRTD